jgi:signal transduction histidine kinase
VKVLRFFWGPRSWLSSINAALDIYVPLLMFVVMFIWVSLLISLAVFVVTIPLFAWLIFATAQLFGRLERARTRIFLGIDVPDPHTPMTGNVFERLWQRTTRLTSWLEVGYTLLFWILAVLGGSIVVSVWAVGFALLLLPFLHNPVLNFGLFTVTGTARWLILLEALGVLLIAPLVARGWGTLNGLIVRHVLGPSRSVALEARVDELTTARSIAVEAAEEERRRIERDLHDGAQQRLVALSMSLGMAKAKFDSDPDAARALLDEAHSESKNAIVELRNLARGIHPVALSDRGLEGAINGLVSRAATPVDVSVDVPARPAAAVEGIAYFVVAELLTNIAKHSQATEAAVDVYARDGELHISVTDNGIGGASLDAGTGLRGLADRVEAVDGDIAVESPTGGPTVVKVRLPMTTDGHS